MSIELGASVDLQLGKLCDRLDQFLTRSELFARLPYPATFPTNADATSQGPYTVLPSPLVPAGRMFDIRRVAVSATGASGDPFTVLASASAILVRSLSPLGQGSATQGAGFVLAALPGNLDLVLDFDAWDHNGFIAAGVPCSKLFTRGTLSLKPGEQCAVIVKLDASGTHLVAHWGVESYPIELFGQP